MARRRKSAYDLTIVECQKTTMFNTEMSERGRCRSVHDLDLLFGSYMSQIRCTRDLENGSFHTDSVGTVRSVVVIPVRLG